MTTIFLIRGFRLGSSAADDDFKIIRKVVQSKDYRVAPIDWTWNYLTMSQYVSRFKEFYDKNKTEKNIVIGHSFGAFAALMAAPDTKPDLTVCCSLSACFKEDIPQYQGHEEPISRIGKRRLEDFEKISFDSIVKRINQQNLHVNILYGELETKQHPLLVGRCVLAAKEIKNASLDIIENADHSIFNSEYMNAIKNSVH